MDPSRQDTASQPRHGAIPSTKEFAETLAPADHLAPGTQDGTVAADSLVTLPSHFAPPPLAPTLPTGVAGYEILGELGRGGMGVVYKARQPRLNRLVAIKMILNAGHASAAELQRFRAEAEAVALLQHPHIVQVYEVGDSDGRPFISLEFCAGGSLDQVIARLPFSPEELARLVEQLARAMHFAHQKGIVHRDLKPANVLLAGEPAALAAGSSTPKITDFGLAKFLDGKAGQTASGAIMGTPGYMAPEQARGKTKDVGPAADVWALGAILYELLTGRPPFLGETALDTLTLLLKEEVVPPRHRKASLPRDLEAICLKCLEKEPSRRYATALQLADDLNRFLTGAPVQAARWSLGTALVRTLRRRRWPIAGVALALAALLVVLWLTRSPSTLAPPEVDPYVEVRRQEIEREVASLRREPPLRISSHPAGHAMVDQIGSVDNSAFEVLDDARVWDLRGWRPVPAGRRREMVSPATMTCRLRLKKVRPAKEFIHQARTSGLDVFTRCLSHPDGHRVLVSRTATHVGQQQTKTRQCVVDINNVPLHTEFNLRFASTFWNSLQDAEDRWVGFIGYPQAFKVSMLLLFPEDRPFTDYRLTVAPTSKADPMPFQGRKIVLSDEQRTYLYWEVLQPEPEQVYRIQWEW